jgi:pseudaminic acid biosynthesis-associated methylase
MPNRKAAAAGEDQESFWSGEFGTQYAQRNVGAHLVAANTALWARILGAAVEVASVLELGAGTGLNLVALRRLLPHARLGAVEINPHALAELRRLGDVRVFAQSVRAFEPDEPWDLVVTKGLLIHIEPDHLADLYDRIYRCSARYICVAEYYNPTPVEVPYRGHRGRLFKRDFAGDLLDRYADLALRDYGFVYHRDRFAQDDLSWFLLAKAGASAAERPARAGQ